MRVIRRTLSEEIGEVTVTAPDGTTSALTLKEVSPGRFETLYEGAEIGLYRLAEGEHETVIGLGPATPREFEQTIATGEQFEPLVEPMRGGIFRLEEGMPSLRDVREGRPASGRGWIGLMPRSAYETRDVTQTAILPPWLVLLIASAFIVGAWLREGRR
jgi:hypothetical protein